LNGTFPSKCNNPKSPNSRIWPMVQKQLAIGYDINCLRKSQDQFCWHALVFALFREDQSVGQRRCSIRKISVHDNAQQGCNMVTDWYGSTIKWRLAKKTRRIESDKFQLKLQLVNKKPIKVELKAQCWETIALMFKIVVLYEIVLNYWL
jgi:hypothetical protein